MKWVVVGVLVCLVRFGKGGALRCTPGVQDPTCNGLELEAPNQLEREGSGRETAAVEAECLAGSEWESNCHHCTCSGAGVAVCLHQADCSQEVFTEPIKCKPNTTFARVCNTCTCLDNGLGLCTLNKCARSSIPKKSELPEGRECAPGTHWRNRCNDCGCSPNGYSFCTEKACTTQGADEEPTLVAEAPMRCAPDSMWRNECNTCWCTSDGLPMCTRIGCIESTVIANTEGNPADTSSSEADKELKRNNNLIEDQLKTNKELDPNLKDNDHSENDHHKFENEDLEIAESHYDTEYQAVAIDYDGNIKEYANDASKNDKDNLIGDGGYQKHAKGDDFHNVLKRSVCKANEVFQSECNTCKCAADGQSYRCTQNECMEGETNKEVEVFMEGEGGDHIERHSVCKARGTFYIGCNTCHCNLYGTDYSCTNKPCPLPEDVELFHELKATKSSKNKTQKIVCVANRMFIKDCNTCWCNDDGTGFFCTRKVCVPDLQDDAETEEAKPEDLRIIEKECRPGEVFELDCNMCRCNPDGKSFSCTRRACVEPIDEEAKNSSLIRKTRAVAQEKDTPKTCQPGQEFRMDCNKCLCDNEGQDFSCTRNDCNAVNNNNGGVRSRRDTSARIPTKCSPGRVFDKDCNVCRCTADGHHATCTLKRCGGEQLNSLYIESKLDPRFRCNPGEKFQLVCNDCSCLADGRSASCTSRNCNQDISSPSSL